jgi:hypothetical protein
MRFWYDIVIPDYEAGTETKVAEGEIQAKDRRDAERKVQRMTKGDQVFGVYKIPLGDEF